MFSSFRSLRRDQKGRIAERALNLDGEGRRLADIDPQRFRGERRYSYSLGNRLGQAGVVQYGQTRAASAT